MKKLTVLLALLLAVALVGCGTAAKENAVSNQQTEIAQNVDQQTSSNHDSVNKTEQQSAHEDKQTSDVPAQRITKDEAKAAALKHAGLTEKDIRFLEIELDDDGYYEVSFDANGYEYDYDVDIKSGKILKSEKERID